MPIVFTWRPGDARLERRALCQQMVRCKMGHPTSFSFEVGERRWQRGLLFVVINVRLLIVCPSSQIRCHAVRTPRFPSLYPCGRHNPCLSMHADTTIPVSLRMPVSFNYPLPPTTPHFTSHPCSRSGPWNTYNMLCAPSQMTPICCLLAPSSVRLAS